MNVTNCSKRLTAVTFEKARNNSFLSFYYYFLQQIQKNNANRKLSIDIDITYMGTTSWTRRHRIFTPSSSWTL